jgi:hypothetical protein
MTWPLGSRMRSGGAGDGLLVSPGIERRIRGRLSPAVLIA